MKLKKASRSDVSVPSWSFSFEADPLLNLSLEEVDSLPVELQKKLRKLQEGESLFIEVIKVYNSLLQNEAKIDRKQRAIGKARDGFRKRVLEMRERCLNAKEEEVEDIGNNLLQLNSEFTSIQERIINLKFQLDELAQLKVSVLEEVLKAKAKHLSRKEEFMMQVVVGEHAAHP